jgi:hypothetical protein
VSERRDLTEAEAFQAMAAFLELYWERGRSEEIATLLGSLAAQEDVKPADPALAEDWAESVKKVASLRGRASMSMARMSRLASRQEPIS